MDIKNWIVWPFVVIFWIILMLWNLKVGDFFIAVREIIALILKLIGSAFYSTIFATLSGVLLYLLIVLWFAIYQKHVDQIANNAEEVSDIKSISDRFKVISRSMDGMESSMRRLANTLEKIQEDMEVHKPLKDIQKSKEIENAAKSFKF